MSDKWVNRLAEDSANRRIAELERENAALTKECLELRSWTRAREDEILARHAKDMTAMTELCAEFQAENAALKRDAERYRWLRDRWTDAQDFSAITFFGADRTYERIDAAIDKARGKNDR